MSDKWRYDLKYRLKRDKEKGTSEYMRKHLALMSRDDQDGLMGFLIKTVRRKDMERFRRGEPTKLRLTWDARTYRVNWEVRSEIWHRLVIKEKLYWVPFFAAYMDISMFHEWFQQDRVKELVELYHKRYGVYP